MANIPLNIRREVAGGDWYDFPPIVQHWSLFYTPNNQDFCPIAGVRLGFNFYIGEVEDIGNQIYTSKSAGMAAMDAMAASQILSTLNSNTFDPNYGVNTYVLGEMVDLGYEIQNAMDLKQDIIADGTIAQYIRGDGSKATFPSLAAVAVSGNYNDLSNKPSLATVATSGSYNDLSNKPTIPGERTFNNPSRSLNTAFQISATQDAMVCYSVDISCGLTLSGGATGTVFLEYADDSGHTTNVKEVTRFVNGNTGTLTIGLNITQNATGTLSGMIPAGKYAKIRTENTSGSPSFTYRSAQEVLF